MKAWTLYVHYQNHYRLQQLSKVKIGGHLVEQTVTYIIVQWQQMTRNLTSSMQFYSTFPVYWPQKRLDDTFHIHTCTFIHRWQRLPCKVPTCSAAAVWRTRTGDLQISGLLLLSPSRTVTPTPRHAPNHDLCGPLRHSTRTSSIDQP